MAAMMKMVKFDKPKTPKAIPSMTGQTAGQGVFT